MKKDKIIGVGMLTAMVIGGIAYVGYKIIKETFEEIKRE